MILPKRGITHPEILADRRLVPKHHVLDPIRLARRVKYQAFIILRAGIHHLTKHVKAREHSEKALVQVFTILLDIVTEHKDVVCV
jgi:hypothetical protein